MSPSNYNDLSCWCMRCTKEATTDSAFGLLPRAMWDANVCGNHFVHEDGRCILIVLPTLIESETRLCIENKWLLGYCLDRDLDDTNAEVFIDADSDPDCA